MTTAGGLVTSRGIRMSFQDDDWVIAHSVEHFGEWEEAVARAIDLLLEPGWTMLDLGAHVGYFSLIAAKRGNPVIAIDADRQAIQLLRENASLNNVNIDARAVALIGEQGRGYGLVRDTAGNPGASYLAPGGEPVSVSAALEEVLAGAHPEFIKVDLEGMEYDVLKAAPDVLAHAQVIVLEAGGHATRYGRSPADVVELLKDSGFAVTYMDGRDIDWRWLDEIREKPDAYVNLLARRNPKKATRATILLCAWREMKIATAECMMKLRDLGWGYAIIGGDALISRSRSKTVSNWYIKCVDEDVFLMLDDDVVFQPEDAEKVVELARKTRSIACAAYPVKDGGHLACRRFVGQDILFGPDSPPVEIEYAATGFMAVHRDVIQAMVEAQKDGEPVFPLCDANGLNPMWPFFDTFTVKWNEGQPNERYEYLSEDYAFCEQARRLGFKVWLDPSVILFHLGTFPYNVHQMKGVRSIEEPNDR